MGWVMANSASGAFNDIVGGFSSGPEDVFESVDVNAPVNFETGLGSSIEYSDLLSLTIDEDKIDTSFSFDSGASYDEYLGGLLDIGDLTDDDVDDIKDFYDSVTCLDLKKSITDWIMDLLDGLSMCGSIEEISKIATIVGSNTLTSYKPTVVADTLSNFSLGGCGPKIPGSCISVNGLVYNDLSEYANGKFMDTLDSIDPGWDVLDDAIGSIPPPFSKSAKNAKEVSVYKPIDLSVFGACSDDAALLFGFSDRTKEASVVGLGRGVNHVSDLRKEYRPYGHYG